MKEQNNWNDPQLSDGDFPQVNFQTLMTHIINLHQREQENLIHYQKYRLEMVSIVRRSMMLFWKITSLTLKFIFHYPINYG